MNTFCLYIFNLLFPLIPETRGFGIKRILLRLAGAKIGNNVRICSSVKILGNRNLVIGENTWIGHQTLLVCSAPITIGADVNIAPKCCIICGTHEITPDGKSIAGKGISLPISIGKGAWVCASSTILAGSNIGEKAIVGAGSIVKGDVLALSLVGNGLAKHIKDL